MTVSILARLAHSLGRRDEAPNIALAKEIAEAHDVGAVSELISLMTASKLAVSYDAIKVLYEAGAIAPALIIPHLHAFLQALRHKDNRMQWGAMTALSVISRHAPEKLSKHLVQIVDAMDAGTVITRDHGIYILCDVARLKKHHANCIELLLEQLTKAPVNQVPMYAEKIASVISQPYVAKLITILNERKDVMEISSKARRINTLIRKLDT